MEEEAGLEAEMEDVTKEINDTLGSLNAAENTVSEIEHETLEMSVNQDISMMQERREMVTRKVILSSDWPILLTVSSHWSIILLLSSHWPIL